MGYQLSYSRQFHTFHGLMMMGIGTWRLAPALVAHGSFELSESTHMITILGTVINRAFFHFIVLLQFGILVRVLLYYHPIPYHAEIRVEFGKLMFQKYVLCVNYDI